MEKRLLLGRRKRSRDFYFLVHLESRFVMRGSGNSLLLNLSVVSCTDYLLVVSIAHKALLEIIKFHLKRFFGALYSDI